MRRRSPRPTRVGPVAALCTALLLLAVPTVSSAAPPASSASAAGSIATSSPGSPATLLTTWSTARTQRAAGVKRWGRTRAPNQVLKPGCRPYRYTYKITAPSDKWMAEIFLVGPKKGHIASATLFSETERATGRRSWRLCRNAVILGRYTMKMKVTWDDGYTRTEGRVPSSRFRLKARR